MSSDKLDSRGNKQSGDDKYSSLKNNRSCDSIILAGRSASQQCTSVSDCSVKNFNMAKDFQAKMSNENFKTYTPILRKKSTLRVPKLSPRPKSTIPKTVVSKPRLCITPGKISSNKKCKPKRRKIGIPQRTVARILKARKFHAYHITFTQHLNFNDYLLRVNFCEWGIALQMIQQDENFFRYVPFSDEVTFSSNGTLNRHNCHYWSDENSHWFRSTNFQNRWSLMVWCGIVNGYLIGPYFF